MVICGSTKSKSSSSKNKKPTTTTPPVTDKGQEKVEVAPEPALRKQKSFYGPSEDIFPIKVDYICTDRST